MTFFLINTIHHCHPREVELKAVNTNSSLRAATSLEGECGVAIQKNTGSPRPHRRCRLNVGSRWWWGIFRIKNVQFLKCLIIILLIYFTIYLLKLKSRHLYLWFYPSHRHPGKMPSPSFAWIARHLSGIHGAALRWIPDKSLARLLADFPGWQYWVNSESKLYTSELKWL